jgi:AhpC/TSA antioxidant enzyme
MTLPEPLQGMAERAPLMLVFLRHFGCTFCRETLADVAHDRAAIAETGAQVAFVHMSPPAEADRWFAEYNLTDLTRISDPDKHLYRLFELEEGSLNQLAHPRVWWPWFRTAVIEGHGAGAAGPNWRQLTGVFVVHRGKVLDGIRHEDSTGRPNYVRFLTRVLDEGS